MSDAIAVRSAIRGRLSVRSNLGWTVTGNAVYAVCQWLLLVVLARAGSAEMVGQFALALAVTAPVVMFTNLQLRNIQATDARDEYRFADYLALRALGAGVALATIVGIVLLGGYARATALAILAVGAFKSVESLSDVVYGLLQKHERMDRIGVSLIIKGVAALAALGALVALTGSIVWGAVGLAAAWAVLLITYDAASALRVLRGKAETGGSAVRRRGAAATVARLAGQAFPLGVAALLASLNATIPRYAVSAVLGDRALGYFAAMAYPLAAGSVILNSLGQATSPRLAVYYLSDARAFVRLMGKTALGGAAMGLVLIALTAAAGGPILGLVYGAEYAHNAATFVWLAVATGAAFVASPLAYTALAVRRFPAYLGALGLAAAVTAAGCWALIPRWGLPGAAWAVCAGMSAQAAGLGVINVHAIWACPARGQ